MAEMLADLVCLKDYIELHILHPINIMHSTWFGSRCGIPFAQRKPLCITLQFEPHKCLLIKIVVPASRRIVRILLKLAVFADSLRAGVKSRTAAVLQVSQDSLQHFWVFVSSTVSVPVLRTCLQRFCKLATSPSASSMLRLLTALRWLLIIAGDVELNPGPTPQCKTIVCASQQSLLRINFDIVFIVNQ